MTAVMEQVQIARYQATGTIAATPPFDFARSLAFLGHFPPMRDEQALSPGALIKAVMIEGRPIVFRVESAGTVEAPSLAYTLCAGEPIEAATERAAIDRIAFFLGLDDDLRPFYAIGRADPAFAPLLDQQYGYHQVKFLTPFENACWAILTQRNPMALAGKMKEALTRRYAAGLAMDGEICRAFPEAAQLAAAGPDELLSIVRNERRAEYLHAVATAFADADEAWLRSGPFEEVERWLRDIKGIGAWSATFILLRGLGRMECVPLGEDRLGEAVSRAYLHGRPATDADVTRYAAPYGPWRGYWAHYLRVTG